MIFLEAFPLHRGFQLYRSQFKKVIENTDIINIFLLPYSSKHIFSACLIYNIEKNMKCEIYHKENKINKYKKKINVYNTYNVLGDQFT